MLEETPLILLPHFPYAHSSTVSEEVESIFSQLSEIFPSSISFTNAGDTSELDRLRKSLEVVNENLRGQALHVLTLYRALMGAQDKYKCLKKHQQEILEEIEDETTRRAMPPKLPSEIVEFICSLACEGRFSVEKESWGNVIYRSIPYFSSYQTLDFAATQTAIAQGAHLHVQFYPNSVDEVLPDLTSTPLGLWKTLELFTPLGRSKPKRFARMIRCCRSALSTVSLLKIDINENHRDGDLRTGPSVFRAGLEDLDQNLSACSTLHAPLAFVPYFPTTISRVSHLKVAVVGLPNIMGFTSPFQGLDLQNLRSLELQSDETNWPLFSHSGDLNSEQRPIAGDLLVVPNLRRLTLVYTELTFGELRSIVDCIQAEGLERLDIMCQIIPMASSELARGFL